MELYLATLFRAKRGKGGAITKLGRQKKLGAELADCPGGLTLVTDANLGFVEPDFFLSVGNSRTSTDADFPPFLNPKI